MYPSVEIVCHAPPGRLNEDAWLVMQTGPLADRIVFAAIDGATTRVTPPPLERYLATLPEQLHLAYNGADPIRVVHATPWSATELLYPDRNPALLAQALGAIEEKVLILGHIHQPGIYRLDGKLAVNAGALSNNLTGQSQISYASLDWSGEGWQPALHILKPDLAGIKASFIETGFYEAAYPFSRAFLESIHTGEDVPQNLLTAAFEQAAAAGLEEIDIIPDDHWLAAGENYPWKMEF